MSDYETTNLFKKNSQKLDNQEAVEEYYGKKAQSDKRKQISPITQTDVSYNVEFMENSTINTSLEDLNIKRLKPTTSPTH